MNLINIIKSPKKYPYYLTKLGATLVGKLRHNGIKAYWWNYVPNAGDLVTPALFRHYGLTPIHTWKDYAEVLSSGSVLQNLPADYSGYILGSGLLNSHSPIQLKKAKLLALRGELTRDAIGAPKNTFLGDPGLLADQLCPQRQKKQYTIGIVPHYSDKTNPNILQLCRRYPKDAHFIDIQHSPQHVINEVDKCEYILSTSLHGLIFADALEIPSAWAVLSNALPASRLFKYRDYNSALKREQHPIYLQGDEPLTALIHNTNRPSKDILEQVKLNLDTAFLQFKREVLEKS